MASMHLSGPTTLITRRQFVLGATFTGATLLTTAVALPTMVSAQATPAAGSSDATSAPANARSGGTIVFSRSDDGDGFDPGTSASSYSYETELHTFDTLTKFKPVSAADLNGGAHIGEVVPGLATSWSYSDDGLTWTFNLRQGVKFHDGTPLDADAVVLNIDRQVNTGSPYYFQGHMVNGTFLYGSLDSYRAVDPATVELHLTQRFAPLLKDLATPAAGIVSPAALKQYGQDIAKNPIGTGPYKFVEWKPNETITLERNPDWWGGQVYLDRIIFRNIPENAAELASLQKGDVDFIGDVTPDNVPIINQDSSLTLYQMAGGLNGVKLRCDRKPFDDVRVRQAVNYAINCDELNQQLYGGLGTVANSPLAPFIPEYDATLAPYGYDPDKAKQLLSDAGYPDGVSAAGLSFLGLGAQPPTPEWGRMLTDGRDVLRQAPWVTTAPGLAILLTAIAFNVFGDSLRDALDPRLKS